MVLIRSILSDYIIFCEPSHKVLDFEEFLGIQRDYPMVFFPAFKLQDQLMKATLGVRIWKKIISEYDSREKKRAGLLGEAPQSYHSRLQELSAWFFEEKRKAMADKEAARGRPRSQRGRRTVAAAGRKKG
jgi:hypothetical protein